MNAGNAPWDLKTQMLAAIKEKGGFANCHAHFDKAYYITKEGLDKSMVDMEQKWLMSDDIKRNSSQEEVEARIRRGLDMLVAQGATATCTFVDAYDAVGHKAIDAAVKVKAEYKGKIDVKIITQPLGGLVDPAARALYEEITAKADIAGGLPSKDRPNDVENLDILFEIAKKLDKPVHVHIDQENNPDERDSEKLADAVERHGYQGRTVAVHAISTSAQPKEYRKMIYKRFAELGIADADDVTVTRLFDLRLAANDNRAATSEVRLLNDVLSIDVTSRRKVGAFHELQKILHRCSWVSGGLHRQSQYFTSGSCR
jgi:hypothetical protein